MTWKNFLLDLSTLKECLSRDLKRLDKLLLILGSYDGPAKLSDIRETAKMSGLKIGKGWNLSTTLSRSKGLAIYVPGGWELTDSGRYHISSLVSTIVNHTVFTLSSNLRKHLSSIRNPTTKSFVEEAIKCYEAELYRSAIVMSWLSALQVLYHEVTNKHLAKFNKEAKSMNAKWKDAINEDGLTRMGEEDFLNRISALGIIGKNQKEELIKCLKLRNGCGHPNSLKVGQNMVANHIETLLLNVFDKYSG